MSTVLVCDDSATVREMLKHNVAAIPGVTRVIVASSGEECLGKWPVERPSVVLLDVRMPGLGGVETARVLIERHPEACLVMLCGPDDADGVSRAIVHGARGYVTKDAPREELSAAVLHVITEGRRTGNESRVGGRAPKAPDLTEREVQVLTGMSRGRSNAEIGRELFLSEDTVKTHARRLFRKLGAADRAQAVAVGYRAGVVR
ncbi:MAG: response regulator [Actinomycetales bacterium]